MSAHRSGTRHKTPEKRQLGRDEWLDAAAAAIAEGGFDNVRILVLAKKLGVTRGSFYWHFQDHAEFISAFLERWRDRRLRELTFWKPTGGDAETELRSVLRFLLSDTARSLRRLRVELAVRDYARRNDAAAAMVAEVDRARLEQATRLLGLVTSDPDEARDLALLLYMNTIGSQVVLTASTAKESTIARMENLIAEFVLSHTRR